MRKIKFYLIISLFITNINLANMRSEYNLEAGINSFSFRSRYEITYNNNVKIYQNYIYKTIDHPTERYLPFKYKLNNNTFINEEGYIQYTSLTTNIILGRKYSSIGPGVLSGLFISPLSPPLDQFSLSVNGITGIEHLKYSKYIVRLDNRSIEWNNTNQMVQRWIYLNSIGFKSKNNKLEINFIDAVIASGFNRDIEWYYLLPLPNLVLERKHQEFWVEGSDTLSEIGQGDNDNHLIGLNAHLRYNNIELYSELLIDEWQLSKNTRSNMQTVFGFMSGIKYQFNSLVINFEYNIASPWLYLNRGLYSNLELQGLPIGLRKPHSQEFIYGFELRINENKYVRGEIRTLNNGLQNLSTRWNAWNNFVDPLKFDSKGKPQFKLNFHNETGKLINNILLYNNWMNNSQLHLIISKTWYLKK